VDGESKKEDWLMLQCEFTSGAKENEFFFNVTRKTIQQINGQLKNIKPE